MTMEFTKPSRYSVKIAAKTQLTATVYHVRYELSGTDTLSFAAGQTFMITIAPGVHRAMSIASPPQETRFIDSYQDVAPMGEGSRWLLDRSVGDVVDIMAPLGRFVVDHESPRKRIFVATGTGIAPIRSMLLDSTRDAVSGRPASLYWGLRHDEDIYLSDELTRLDADRETLVCYLTLSQPSDAWQGFRGHVTDQVFANEKALADCDYYLCGNRKMISEMQDRLTQAGVPREQMKFDPYY